MKITLIQFSSLKSNASFAPAHWFLQKDFLKPHKCSENSTHNPVLPQAPATRESTEPTAGT